MVPAVIALGKTGGRVGLPFNELQSRGVSVLGGLFSSAEITLCRDLIAGHLDMMGQTRATAHSYHLAGFHRFPAFAPIRALIAGNPAVQAMLSSVFGPDMAEDIGLTDITVNRSQPWHTDLLRGPYAQFLADCDPWDPTEDPCLKVLLYLQPGRSLRYVPGSHLTRSPLDDEAIARQVAGAEVLQLELAAGDVVILDLRTLHRGSTDAEMADPGLASSPKMLVSAVYGRKGSRFAEAMRHGNARRMADWDARFLPAAVSA